MKHAGGEKVAASENPLEIRRFKGWQKSEARQRQAAPTEEMEID